MPACMKGRGKEAPRRRVEGGPGDLPEISLDFCFPSKEDGSGMLTILGARERHTKMTLSTVIPSKTTSTFAARRVWAFLREIGRKRYHSEMRSRACYYVASLGGQQAEGR